MKRLALRFTLFLMCAAPIFAQSSLEKCQAGACYGFGAPSGLAANGYIFQDVSQSPPALYCAKNQAWVSCGGSGGSFLPLTGGTLTGPVVLPGVPTTALQAATKSYVDAATTAINPVSGASAEYPMLDSSGTTVSDISGSGHNATFGSTAPSWLSYGVAFLNTGTASGPAQSITTPITTLGSFYIAHCTPTMVLNTGISSGLSPVTQFQPFTSTSNSASGLFLASSSGAPWNTTVSVIPTVITLPGFAQPTSASYSTGGCHIYGWTINSPTDSKDHITIDGVEIPGYTAQGSSASFETISSGTYVIGADPFGNALRGVVSYAIYYPASHTVAQMQQVSLYIQGKLNQRATFPHYPVLSNAITPQLVFVGDSLTAGYQGSSQWTGTLSTTNTYTITNYGIAGLLAIDACQLWAQRWGQSIVPGQTTIHFWAGTNEVTVPAVTPANAWLALSSCASRAKSLGARTIVSTMISGSGRDTFKDAFNLLIRSQYKSAGFDYLNDVAAVSAIGNDGAFSTTACFNGDQTHLTGPGAGTCATIGTTALSGYGIIAALVSGAVNTLDGSSPTRPDVTTSNTFVSTYANNYVLMTPTAAATYSLVDCQGQSSTRSIVNKSTFAVTVSAINSQTISGSTTVAAGASAVYLPVLTSNVAGGCSWLRTQ